MIGPAHLNLRDEATGGTLVTLRAFLIKIGIGSIGEAKVGSGGLCRHLPRLNKCLLAVTCRDNCRGNAEVLRKLVEQ